MQTEIKLHSQWSQALASFLKSPKWKEFVSFMKNEYKLKKIYPNQKDVFKAFNLTPFSKVKVVILGQDPYHGVGQAHGLCFSVPEEVMIPPSLQNIYKEIESDLGVKKDFKNGNLEEWAQQGVLLLNTILTVVAGQPASHQDKGWEEFTDYVIKTISDKKEHVVFMLWGNYARSKKSLIDTSKHLVLESTHPSPFSAHAGFFGSKPFSQCNSYLQLNGKAKIIW